MSEVTHGTVYKSERSGNKSNYGIILEVDNQLFNADGNHKTISGEERYYWKCSTKHCKSRITTKIDENNSHIVIKTRGKHYHSDKREEENSYDQDTDEDQNSQEENPTIEEESSTKSEPRPISTLKVLTKKETLGNCCHSTYSYFNDYQYYNPNTTKTPLKNEKDSKKMFGKWEFI